MEPDNREILFFLRIAQAVRHFPLLRGGATARQDDQRSTRSTPAWATQQESAPTSISGNRGGSRRITRRPACASRVMPKIASRSRRGAALLPASWTLDSIMIVEMRDPRDGRARLIDASLTGHMCFSTLPHEQLRQQTTPRRRITTPPADIFLGSVPYTRFAFRRGDSPGSS